MKKIIASLILGVGAIAFFACDDGIDYEKLRQEELAIMEDYLEMQDQDFEETSSGLHYYLEEGTGVGDSIRTGYTVQLFYATWTLNSATGTSDDSTLVDQTSGYLDGHRYEPYEVIVGSGGSIQGLEEGLLYMETGTRGHLVINSELAYGQNGSPQGGIGGFQTVLMEVEIYKVIPFEIPE